MVLLCASSFFAFVFSSHSPRVQSSDSEHKIAHNDWSCWPHRSCANSFTNISDSVFHPLEVYPNATYIPSQEQSIQYPFSSPASFQTFQPQLNTSYPAFDTTFQVSDTRHHQYSQSVDNSQFHGMHSQPTTAHLSPAHPFQSRLCK